MPPLSNRMEAARLVRGQVRLHLATFGHALNVENPQVGTFSRSTLYSKLTLVEAQANWLLASVPTPNVTEGWRISAVLLRYTIRGRAGVIDKVGLRDGEQLVDFHLASAPL
jgi:hypothetical protein